MRQGVHWKHGGSFTLTKSLQFCFSGYHVLRRSFFLLFTWNSKSITKCPIYRQYTLWPLQGRRSACSRAPCLACPPLTWEPTLSRVKRSQAQQEAVADLKCGSCGRKSGHQARASGRGFLRQCALREVYTLPSPIFTSNTKRYISASARTPLVNAPSTLHYPPLPSAQLSTRFVHPLSKLSSLAHKLS